jgi:hypothetical protein
MWKALIQLEKKEKQFRWMILGQNSPLFNRQKNKGVTIRVWEGKYIYAHE